jgi:hypothetical protein
MMNNAQIDPAFSQDLNAQPPVQTFNPGIKPSGAPVNFNPTTQNTMTNMFGTPVAGSFDRMLNVPQQPQVGIAAPTTYNQQTY